ncbi:rRNA maturation RNase YbeY [Patescibacteria group bacterium]|nr:rRNA maturation RNase YbeY [Patescibacteria group bacterium]
MRTVLKQVDVRTLTRRSAPVFAHEKIAKAILPGWNISLVFAGTKRAQSLNKSLRGKTYIPNVLSYSLGKKSGEIIICLEIAKKQSSSYGVSYPHFVIFLFIHGLLHLKGKAHGTTMERHERSLLKRFTGETVTYGTTHRNGH